MPRRSGGGGRPAPRAPPRPDAVKRSSSTTAAPPPARTSGGGGGGGSFLGDMASTMASGMAFGTGSAFAHRAVDSFMGPRTMHVEHQNAPSEASSGNGGAAVAPPQQQACAWEAQAFQECVQSNSADIARCQFYLDSLKNCRQASNVE